MSSYVMIMTTLAAPEEAALLARVLVEQRLAACVQSLPIQSCYAWDGEIRSEAEVLLLIKTRADLQTAVADVIATRHPYALPEVAAVPIGFGSPAYLAWIDGQTMVPTVRAPGEGDP